MKGLLLFCILFSLHFFGQDFSQYHWKNRIIAVFSNSFECDEAKEQLRMLQENQAALDERKLVVYHLTPLEYRENFSDVSEACFQKINVNRNFMVVLVGLDGFTKYTEYSPQPAEKFFSFIDQMPIRLTELKKG